MKRMVDGRKLAQLLGAVLDLRGEDSHSVRRAVRMGAKKKCRSEVVGDFLQCRFKKFGAGGGVSGTISCFAQFQR